MLKLKLKYKDGNEKYDEEFHCDKASKAIDYVRKKYLNKVTATDDLDLETIYLIEDDPFGFDAATDECIMNHWDIKIIQSYIKKDIVRGTVYQLLDDVKDNIQEGSVDEILPLLDKVKEVWQSSIKDGIWR